MVIVLKLAVTDTWIYRRKRMKGRNYLAWAVAPLMAAAFCIVAPGISAQPSQTSPQPGAQSQAQPQSKVFAGRVMKLQDGRYALVTGKTPDGKLAGHFLDDQNDAQKYEGKQVKVTGTLDMASNTIHVTNIQSA
jgi:Protein of unknown function (DUF5818)